MTDFPTSNSFFVSEAGRRLQKRLQSFLAKEEIKDLPSVLIGPDAPFLQAFEQNRPDIIMEKETLPDNAALVSLPAAGSVAAVFMAVLNTSVANGCLPLIKEIHRILKPQGRFFLIIKNTAGFWPVQIKEMPSLSARLIRREIIDAGFLLKRQQSILSVPFHGKTFDLADEYLFSLKIKIGVFSLFAAEKKPFVIQTSKNYNSARITKASVLTSPRT
ncbi:MAG: hypothetical protein ACI4TE_03210 [Alphaproteobacteria bacterium]